MPQRPTDEQRLTELLRARHPCIRITTTEEADAVDLLREVAMRLDRPLALWSVVQGTRDGLVAGGACDTGSENPIVGLHALLKRSESGGIGVALDIADHLEDPRIVRVLREIIDRVEVNRSSLILIDHSSHLPDVIRAHTTPLELGFPDEAEIDAIVKRSLRAVNADTPLKIEMRQSQLDALIRNLRGMNRRQIAQVITDVVASDRLLDESDIAEVLEKKRTILSQGGLLEFVQTPVDMSQVGGIVHLREWLAARQNALSDEAAAFGIEPPRGVLMLGVQGAGKSLCAKAIATAWQRPLLRMDVGALYDRFVGESERRLRDSLHQAEMMAPVILWIDEIEKAFASAAAQSNDGGLSKRMFGTLLTWMQDHRAPVFLVATANDIEALPPELMRKGRFDEIFFVDLPGPDARLQIVKIHLAKRKQDPAQFDMERLVDASEGFSGAEIEQAVISGLHGCFSRRTLLTTEDVVKAMVASPPLSVTMAEKIDRLRRWAEGRCVPAG